jgi:hypothetical protein
MLDVQVWLIIMFGMACLCRDGWSAQTGYRPTITQAMFRRFGAAGRRAENLRSDYRQARSSRLLWAIRHPGSG